MAVLSSLVVLCEQKDVSVADVKNGSTRVTFRRWLDNDLQNCWDLISKHVADYTLQESDDIVSWKFEKSQNFSVKSLYNALTATDAGLAHKQIWKGKVPPKIKIFIWLMTNDALLTKDNLIKRHWSGDSKCQFCDQIETIDHLFFSCSIAKVIWGLIAIMLGATDLPSSLSHFWTWCARWLPNGKKCYMWGLSAIFWAIWKARNKACFDGKLIRSPIEIIYHAGALMRFWTGLYTEVDRMMLINGVNTMLKVASDILLPKSPKEDLHKRLKHGGHDDDDDDESDG